MLQGDYLSLSKIETTEIIQFLKQQSLNPNNVVKWKIIWKTSVFFLPTVAHK